MDYDSAVYAVLYVVIASLTPAWPLGVLEYNSGAAVAWIAIFLANVSLWLVPGACLVLISARRAKQLCYAVIVGAATTYAYWASGGFIEPVIALAVMVILYLRFSGKNEGCNA